MVAAAFGVFKPAVVVGGVAHGWTLTDASTIFHARRNGAVAQLQRVIGPPTDGLARAGALLDRAVAPLRPEGRPLFAGLRSRWDDPVDAWTRFFHLGDMLREYRGDAHVAAWTSAELDAVEIGLLTEAYIGLPLRTYIRTRAWDDRELDAAVARLEARGWMQDDALTDVGRTGREAVEDATDRALRPALEALGDDADELFGILEPWARRCAKPAATSADPSTSGRPVADGGAASCASRAHFDAGSARTRTSRSHRPSARSSTCAPISASRISARVTSSTSAAG